MTVPNHRMSGPMYIDQEPQHNLVAPMKNMNMNNYNQQYPPSMQPQQQQAMAKKTERNVHFNFLRDNVNSKD